MFGFSFNAYDVSIELYIGNKLVNRQFMQAPKEMLMIQFMQLVDQVGQDSRPMKARMIRQEIIWDKFEGKNKTLDSIIEFRNNAMEGAN